MHLSKFHGGHGGVGMCDSGFEIRSCGSDGDDAAPRGKKVTRRSDSCTSMKHP
jgi:hypothetical protein